MVADHRNGWRGLTAFARPQGFECDGFFSPSLRELCRQLHNFGWPKGRQIQIRSDDDLSLLGTVSIRDVVNGGAETSPAWWLARKSRPSEAA